MAEQMNVDEVTPDMVVEQMPQYFQADKAGSTNATILFDLSGENPGQWWIKIAEGIATSGKGAAENPNLTLTADSKDWTRIMLGQQDATAAFMQGKLKIKGDMGLAIKMQSLFKRPA